MNFNRFIGHLKPSGKASKFLNPSTDLKTLPAVLSSIQTRNNYTHIELAISSHAKLKHRSVPHGKPSQTNDISLPKNFRHVYPDFLPTNSLILRNKLFEHIERRDMLARRKHLDVPEFYVGSILSVQVNDANAVEKTSKFVGICIDRGGNGMRSWFILRNVIDGQGIEIRYDIYAPVIKSIETLRLEKRLDEELLYLRDALPEYSTFPLDMEQELISDDAPVPINDLKVKMLPRPWHKTTFRDWRGIDYEDHITEKEMLMNAKNRELQAYKEYDLMMQYRNNIPEEEQEEIFQHISPQYEEMRKVERVFRRKHD